jgi:maltose alpha-D-glucosyltransferase/alpha-amylase
LPGAELDLSAFAGRVPIELFSHASFPEVKATPVVFTLGPHDFFWFELRAAPEHGVAAGRTIRALHGPPEWTLTLRDHLAENVLPNYLPACRWFTGNAAALRELSIREEIAMDDTPDAARLLSSGDFSPKDCRNLHLAASVCFRARGATAPRRIARCRCRTVY